MVTKKQTPIAPFATPTEMLLHNINTGGKCLGYERIRLDAYSNSSKAIPQLKKSADESDLIVIPDGTNSCILYVETNDPETIAIRLNENGRYGTFINSLPSSPSAIRQPTGIPLASGTFYEIGGIENIENTVLLAKSGIRVLVHFHFYS